MASNKETQLQEDMLAVFQNSSTFRNLPPAARPIINQVIAQSVQNRTSELINKVETQSNQQIDQIQNDLVGVKNPVNVVSGNLNTTQLNDVIDTSIGQSVTDEFSSKISSDIIDNFQLLLPPQLSSSVNFNLLKTSIDIASKLTAETGVKSSIDQFSKQVLSGQFKPSSFLSDVNSIFSSNPIAAFQQIGEQFDSSLSNEAINAARNFDIKNADNEEKLITQTLGFIDPSAEYPTKEYKGISEVNKLAQGTVNGTIVQQKEKERTLGAQLPNNQSWQQPPSPFKGEYPHNKVTQTESGHIIEIDDTPGCERIHVYHKSGTFIEIDANGTIVKKTKGSSYEIIEKNGHISITGTANLSVKGSIKMFVGGDADIEVEGDTNIKSLNDVTVQAAGKINLSATEEINIASANINIEAYNTLNIKSGVILNAFAENDLNFKSNVNLFAESPFYYNKSVSFYNQVATDLYEKIGGSRFSEVDTEVHFKSAGSFNADASRIDLNNGTASNSEDSKPAVKAGPSLIGVIGVRKDIVKETIPDPIAPNFLDKFGYDIEDSEFDDEAIAKQKQFRQKGVLSDEELNETLAEINRNSPVSRSSTIIFPSDTILQQTFLPDNYQLSKNFTLASLSSKAAVTNNPVKAQVNLTYGQIIFNLQGIALNVCEPILALFPNMIVTSAFRATANSASTSDHPKGKAVDLQFRGVSKNDYFDIAKKLATFLNYDKLLLEYKTYGTGMPWIHISFDINQQRKTVLTYLNDKKFGDGLISLA